MGSAGTDDGDGIGGASITSSMHGAAMAEGVDGSLGLATDNSMNDAFQRDNDRRNASRQRQKKAGRGQLTGHPMDPGPTAREVFGDDFVLPELAATKNQVLFSTSSRY